MIFRGFLSGCISFNDFVRGRVFAGLLYLAPFLIALAVIAWIYGTVAGAIEPFFFGDSDVLLPFVTVVVILFLPFSLGMILLSGPGRRVMGMIGHLAERTPFAGSIYRVGKDVSTAFDPGGQTGFNRVVQVEYPRRGMWALGFLTSTVTFEDGSIMGSVFLPTAPLPNSGWVAFLPIEDIFELEMSTGEAMQITLSGGIVMPSAIVRSRLELTSVVPAAAANSLRS